MSDDARTETDATAPRGEPTTRPEGRSEPPRGARVDSDDEERRRLEGVRDALAGGLAWVGEPGNLRRVLLVAIPVLVLAALLLPPLSLFQRLATPGYERLRAGESASVPARGQESTILEVTGPALLRSTRARLRAGDRLPGGSDGLPPGAQPISKAYDLDFSGPLPSRGRLVVTLPIQAEDQPYVDPFGWDGERWRWLAPEWVAGNRARIHIPFDEVVPETVVVTLAESLPTRLSATLAPGPDALPAAAAQLPRVEARALRLADDEGRVELRPGQPALPAGARRLAVIDNLHGAQVRDDLLTNLLIRPESRRRHREELVALVRRDDWDGLVLDYRGIPDDLTDDYVDFVELLAEDLRAQDRELVVTVPMPRTAEEGWDTGTLSWRRLGAAADGLRIRLPDDRPLELEELDALLRWALGQVDRRVLQLALPMQGRDTVEGSTTRISFGDALRRMLDMARSDAPREIAPGREAVIDLPTIRAAELGRDPETGLWRFYYWDDNRRKHTVWLNDAAGLRPAFDVAARYRIAQLALDGVSAGMDPALWALVSSFQERGRAQVGSSSYRLQWQLVDEQGRVVQESLQPLEEATFTMRAPSAEGAYELAVNLVDERGELAAWGAPLAVAVAPPPPPSPTPTIITYMALPTPETYATAPPPADERGPTRAPVRIGGSSGPETPEAPSPEADLEVAFASAALRGAPDTGADALSDLRRGDLLTRLGVSEDGAWVQVRVISTGLEGWVLAELLAEVSGRDASGRMPDASATPSAASATRPGPGGDSGPGSGDDGEAATQAAPGDASSGVSSPSRGTAPPSPSPVPAAP